MRTLTFNRFNVNWLLDNRLQKPVVVKNITVFSNRVTDFFCRSIASH